MAKKGSDPVSTAISNEPASTAISNEPPTNTITINLDEFNKVVELKNALEDTKSSIKEHQDNLKTSLEECEWARKDIQLAQDKYSEIQLEYKTAVVLLDNNLRQLFPIEAEPPIMQYVDSPEKNPRKKRVPGTVNPQIVAELKKLFKSNKQVDIAKVKNQLSKQFNCPAKDVTASMETIADRITTGNQGLSSIFELK